jgi:hypothetical protein
LLPFSSEPSVISSAVEKCGNWNIKDSNLSVVLYGCETWSLTVREERRLRMKRIFGLKKDEMMESEGLCDLCSSPSIIRILKSQRMRGQGMQHE